MFTVDPSHAFGAAVCLFLIACWAAVQVQSRCGRCTAVPVRCRCARRRMRRGSSRQA